MQSLRIMTFVMTWGKNNGECDRQMVKSLDSIPYGEIPKWGMTARKLIDLKQKLGLGMNPKNVKAVLRDDWTLQLADEIHFPIQRKFKKRRVVLNGMDQIWAADLIEIRKFSKWNKRIKYLLMVIDIFEIRLD